MANYLSPIGNGQHYVDSNGNPLSGAKLFTYTAGSSTKRTTYTNQAGSASNANPIELDANGRPPDPIWLIGGVSYKFVLAPSSDTDPPVSAIETWDNISGINDTAQTDVDEWIDGPAPTFVDTDEFTLVGDQTTDFHVGRRLKLTVGAGTVYGRISVSAYTTLTTVTVVLDSGVLDSGLSAVYLSLITVTNPSIDVMAVKRARDGSVEAITNIQNFTSGIGPDYIQNLSIAAATSANALTVSLKGKDGNDPSSTNVVEIALRSTTITSGTYNVRQITAAHSVVAPSGATLGFAASETSNIHIFEADDGSTREIGVCGKSFVFDQTRLHSTTAIGTGSDSAGTLYTTSALTSAAIRYLGYIVIQTGATPGQWGSDPTVIGSVPDSVAYDVIGLKKLLTVTFSGALTVDVPMSVFSDFRNKKVVADFQPSNDAVSYQMRFSTDTGATFDAAAGNYSYAHTGNDSAGASTGSGNTDGTNPTSILLTPNFVGNASTEGLAIDMTLFHTTSTALWTKAVWLAAYIDSTASPRSSGVFGNGARRAAQDTDTLRFFPSAGTTAGTLTLYGYP